MSIHRTIPRSFCNQIETRLKKVNFLAEDCYHYLELMQTNPCFPLKRRSISHQIDKQQTRNIAQLDTRDSERH